MNNGNAIEFKQDLYYTSILASVIISYAINHHLVAFPPKPFSNIHILVLQDNRWPSQLFLLPCLQAFVASLYQLDSFEASQSRDSSRDI